jgi:hypothetical protein
VEVVSNNYYRGGLIEVRFDKKVQEVSLLVTENRFEVTGKNRSVIDIREIDDWEISGNLFSGASHLGITADAYMEPNSSGGVVVTNSFLNFNADFKDIYLGEGTTKCIIGSGQDASVSDNGAANTIL